MRKFILFMFLICQTSVYAAEECVTLNNMPNWTLDQKGARQRVCAKLAGDNGQTTLSNESFRFTEIEICIVDPIFNVNTVYTEQAILDEYTAQAASIAASLAAGVALIQTANTEIDGNEIRTKNLTNVNEWIDTNVDAITNLSDSKVFLKMVLKKLARYLIAREYTQGERTV